MPEPFTKLNSRFTVCFQNPNETLKKHAMGMIEREIPQCNPGPTLYKKEKSNATTTRPNKTISTN